MLDEGDKIQKIKHCYYTKYGTCYMAYAFTDKGNVWGQFEPQVKNCNNRDPTRLIWDFGGVMLCKNCCYKLPMYSRAYMKTHYILPCVTARGSETQNRYNAKFSAVDFCYSS